MQLKVKKMTGLLELVIPQLNLSSSKNSVPVTCTKNMGYNKVGKVLVLYCLRGTTQLLSGFAVLEETCAQGQIGKSGP